MCHPPKSPFFLIISFQLLHECFFTIARRVIKKAGGYPPAFGFGTIDRRNLISFFCFFFLYRVWSYVRSPQSQTAKTQKPIVGKHSAPRPFLFAIGCILKIGMPVCGSCQWSFTTAFVYFGYKVLNLGGELSSRCPHLQFPSDMIMPLERSWDWEVLYLAQVVGKKCSKVVQEFIDVRYRPNFATCSPVIQYRI